MITFNFGGKNSFEDYGIYVSTRPSIPSPKRRISNVSIPGRNSNLRFDDNTYEDITIKVECSIKGEILLDKIDEIKGWLLGAGESELIFSFQNNKKYIAQVVNSIDFSQVFKYFSKFIIIFNCQPFKYSVDNEIITITNTKKIINPGSVYSEPILKVFGSGNINLEINKEIIKLEDIKEHIIIDGIQQNCYDDNLENANYKMSGEFPKLNMGENNITWSGNVSKMEVIPNWRWL